MALITCKDCKKEYSNNTWRCIHCGAHKPVSKRMKDAIFIAWGIAFILIFLAAVKNPSTKPAIAYKPPNPDPLAYAKCLQRELQAFEANLLKKERAGMTPEQLRGYQPEGFDVISAFADNADFVTYFNSRCKDEANDYIFNHCVPSGQYLAHCLMDTNAAPNIVWTNKKWKVR